MADEIMKKIIDTPRLRTLSVYLQAVYGDLKHRPSNEELEREMAQDIADLSTLASLALSQENAMKESKGGEK